MNIIKAIKGLFGHKEIKAGCSKKTIIIDTYSPVSDLIMKKELNDLGELYVKGPARGGKDDELFDYIKSICNKYEKLSKLDLSGVEGMGIVKEEALADCKSLNEVVLPKGVLKIDNNAFAGCTNLVKMTLPEGLERIGESAFERCENLSGIELPQSLFRVGRDAFAGCDKIEKISLPCHVESIGTGALKCKKLKEITVEAHNPSYISREGNLYSRNGSALIIYALGKPENEFTIPEDVAKIGEYVFADSRLKKVNITKHVNIIGKNAFMNCDEMEEIKIPQNVERIDNEAFMNCKNLRKIELATGVNSIGDKAFADCAMLENINIPATVMKLGDEALANCTSLQDVKLPTSIQYMGQNVLKGTPAEKNQA